MFKLNMMHAKETGHVLRHHDNNTYLNEILFGNVLEVRQNKVFYAEERKIFAITYEYVAVLLKLYIMYSSATVNHDHF